MFFDSGVQAAGVQTADRLVDLHAKNLLWRKDARTHDLQIAITDFGSSCSLDPLRCAPPAATNGRKAYTAPEVSSAPNHSNYTRSQPHRKMNHNPLLRPTPSCAFEKINIGPLLCRTSTPSRVST